MKDIFENTVTVRRDKEQIVPPTVQYVEPLSPEEVDEIQKVRSFFLSKSYKTVTCEENVDLLEFARDWNTRTHQTLNGTMLYGNDFCKAQFFGACDNLPQPEKWCAPDGSVHFATYLQMKDKYKEVGQQTIKMPPVQGREVLTFCCDRNFRFQSQLVRHKRIMHGRCQVADGPKRKRPQTKGFANRGPAKKSRRERDEGEEEAPRVDEEEEEDGEGQEEEEEEEEWEVETIVGVKMVRGVRHYVVRWKGSGEEDDTTLPIENLGACKELVDQFEAREQDRNLSRSLCLGLRNTANKTN